MISHSSDRLFSPPWRTLSHNHHEGRWTSVCLHGRKEHDSGGWTAWCSFSDSPPWGTQTHAVHRCERIVCASLETRLHGKPSHSCRTAEPLHSKEEITDWKALDRTRSVHLEQVTPVLSSLVRLILRPRPSLEGTALFGTRITCEIVKIKTHEGEQY